MPPTMIFAAFAGVDCKSKIVFALAICIYIFQPVMSEYIQAVPIEYVQYVFPWFKEV